MKLKVNGEEREVREGATLLALLEDLRLTPGRLACEVNAEIVRRAAYGATPLKSGDAVEIVQMIGGG